MRQVIKQWPKQKWSYNIVYQFWKYYLPWHETWDRNMEHTTMVLSFRIKLRKDCPKNTCLHLCRIWEVIKPSSKMTLISRDSGYVAGASKITYTVLWQFFNTNKFKRNIYYSLLDASTFLQDRFKIGRVLSQVHKSCETFYGSNSRWPNASFDIEKNRLQVVWCHKNSSWSIWGACTKII